MAGALGGCGDLLIGTFKGSLFGRVEFDLMDASTGRRVTCCEKGVWRIVRAKVACATRPDAIIVARSNCSW